ncbi:MAG: aminoacyl-tRNA hydrolase [Bacteroidales bacterium]|nr:aminoacyl-tRNA hydrolase [Bacteroidales bacterium]
MKYLIVGLGNIGTEYTNTRHNIGFTILDAYVEASNIIFETKRYGDIAQKKIKGRQVFFLKPSTYMNLSGKALRYWMQNEKIPIENVLILTDDINIPLGKVRIRTKGSDGGHNGLKNISEILGHSNFNRLRFGIGKEFGPGEQIDYVLGEWSADERKEIESRKKHIFDAINSFVTTGIERTMNFYNIK